MEKRPEIVRATREAFINLGIISPAPKPAPGEFVSFAARPTMSLEAVRRTREHHIKTGTIKPKQKKRSV